MSTTMIIYALIAGLLPSFIWLYYWTREDRLHPEPKTLIAGCFLGGTIAVFFAIIAEQYIADIVTDNALKYTLWAGIEELVKFIAVAVIALHTLSNDEPIDAMIYCVTVALGFAAFENMLFILSPLSEGEIAKSIITGNMRFIGATLVHIVSSAIVGFALGWAFYRDITTKILAVILGLIGATLIHTAFNLSIINTSGSDILKVFAWIWITVIVLLVLFEEIKVVKPKLSI